MEEVCAIYIQFLP